MIDRVGSVIEIAIAAVTAHMDGNIPPEQFEDLMETLLDYSVWDAQNDSRRTVTAFLHICCGILSDMLAHQDDIIRRMAAFDGTPQSFAMPLTVFSQQTAPRLVKLWLDHDAQCGEMDDDR